MRSPITGMRAICTCPIHTPAGHSLSLHVRDVSCVQERTPTLMIGLFLYLYILFDSVSKEALLMHPSQRMHKQECRIVSGYMFARCIRCDDVTLFFL